MSRAADFSGSGYFQIITPQSPGIKTSYYDITHAYQQQRTFSLQSQFIYVMVSDNFD